MRSKFLKTTLPILLVILALVGTMSGSRVSAR